MTKLELQKLHEMQKSNSANTENTLEALWKIGDEAEIHHISCYQAMFTEIMLSAEISTKSKGKALYIFETWAKKQGRKEERRDTGFALGSSWFED
ncbi:hypothetical protein LJB90_03650 [Eubacteriales bacterium OttesenSCG-928-G02]|nr:hypothetical protein [Eubacteriales bacterium OttesenSCG-928-G02]